MKLILIFLGVLLLTNCNNKENKMNDSSKINNNINPFSDVFQDMSFGKLFQINDLLRQELYMSRICWPQALSVTQINTVDYFNLRIRSLRCYATKHCQESSEVFEILIFEDLQNNDVEIGILNFVSFSKDDPYEMFESASDFTGLENIINNSFEKYYKKNDFFCALDELSWKLIHIISYPEAITKVTNINLDSIFVEIQKSEIQRDMSEMKINYITKCVSSPSCFVYLLEANFQQNFSFIIFSFTDQHGYYFESNSTEKHEGLLKKKININMFFL